MFDAKTRTAIQQNLVGFGDTLAGRGSALNDTIASLPQLFVYLRPVASYLSAPEHRADAVLRLARAASWGRSRRWPRPTPSCSPSMATTFEAISHRTRRDLGADDRASRPRPMQVATKSLKVQQPFLVDLTTLGNELTPATAELKPALPEHQPGDRGRDQDPGPHAVAEPEPPAGPGVAEEPVAGARGPTWPSTALTSTVTTLNPMVKYLGPYQTVCDDWNYFWTYLSDLVSEQTALRQCPARADQPRQPGSDQQRRPAGRHRPGQRRRQRLADSPAATSTCTRRPTAPPSTTNGDADCETGQRGYPSRSSTTSIRSIATSPPIRTRPADQGTDLRRPQRACPRARRSAATR